MERLLVGIAIAAVVLGACGGGSSAPGPTAPPPDTGAGPSGTTGPTGTTGPVGSPNTGPGSSTPPTSTTPPSTTPTTGSPPPPTAPSACDGLVPASPGDGVQYTGPGGGGIASCVDPITDGHGEWIGIGASHHYWGYTFVSATAPGAPVGSLRVGAGRTVAPQPDGYLAVNATGFPGSLRRYDAQGNLLSDDGSNAHWSIAGLPGGGSVGLVSDGFNTPSRSDRLVWTDATGAERASATFPSGHGDPDFVVAARGDVLVLLGDQARWYDRNGAPTTDWFSSGATVGGSNSTWTDWQVDMQSAVLADGSVVVGLGSPTALRFEPGTPSSSPAPDWVTARAGATIAAVRGNAANAFATITKTGSGCYVALEILTPDGQSCGTTHLSPPASACDRVSFGADRTVFTTGEDDTGATSCSWHWWSGLLR